MICRLIREAGDEFDDALTRSPNPDDLELAFGHAVATIMTNLQSLVASSAAGQDSSS